jgi:(1->4)-alpha-D-glucan 1-alpha-D-glucosylmutase
VAPSEPLATYRLQLHARFGFDQAAAVADYLEALGVSHVYCSPYLDAVPGSTHGYDVIDHHRVSRDLGGAEAHARFCLTLGRHHLGQLLDVVPNHMAIHRENRWWWDVLENGPASPYAAYFDVDWDPPEAKLRNTVLLPVLADHYGRVLEAGELRVEREGGGFIVRYGNEAWPLAPASADQILAAAAERCQSDELAFLADSLARLPRPTITDPAALKRRHRDKEVLRAHLARLCQQEPKVAAAIDAQLIGINASPDALDAICERQNYRLSFWKAAARDLGYRRFFDINTLVGVRVEDERVFEDTHARILAWLADGVIDGVRIDHPDGLADPADYFRRLREARPAAWIVAEKILMRGERPRELWGIAGTTGYDFMNRVLGLLIDPGGEAPLTELYGRFTGESTDWPTVAYEKRKQVMREVLGSDLNRLAGLFLEICERHRRMRDYTRHELHDTVREVVACFPVYRTYVRADQGMVSDDDVRYVNEALDAAQARRPDLDPSLLDFFGNLLLLRTRGAIEADLVKRFQQLTGPAMAKGIEDTAFYGYNRLVALNEVGGDPGRWGTSLEEFHAACAETQMRWPKTMLATSTHDTKRSEDVRVRIALISEIPDCWERAVARWSALLERHRSDGLPDRNMEYLFYQTLVGAWPIETERMVAYMEKASREAKTHTSWTSPSRAYDEALRRFVESALGDAEFRGQMDAFVQPLVQPARVTALAQTLLRLTCPGVPDTYQGTELWTQSLVDPDNRRPVDYEMRRRLLAELEGATPERILARMDEALPKLWVLVQAQRLRARRPEAFGLKGDYRPLPTSGPRTCHVVAFSRGEAVATVVPRLVIRLKGDWQDTSVTLPRGRWCNELTGDVVDGGPQPVASLLARFPVALLSLEGGAPGLTGRSE